MGSESPTDARELKLLCVSTLKEMSSSGAVYDLSLLCISFPIAFDFDESLILRCFFGRWKKYELFVIRCSDCELLGSRFWVGCSGKIVTFSEQPKKNQSSERKKKTDGQGIRPDSRNSSNGTGQLVCWFKITGGAFSLRCWIVLYHCWLRQALSSPSTWKGQLKHCIERHSLSRSRQRCDCSSKSSYLHLVGRQRQELKDKPLLLLLLFADECLWSSLVQQCEMQLLLANLCHCLCKSCVTLVRGDNDDEQCFFTFQVHVQRSNPHHRRCRCSQKGHHLLL